MTALRHVAAPDGVAAGRGYSQVVTGRGRLVVVSGQIAQNDRGDLVGPGDPAAQARQVFANLSRALAAEGDGYAVSRRIVAMSRRTAADLVGRYAVPQDKIDVIPPGANIPESRLEEFDRQPERRQRGRIRARARNRVLDTAVIGFHCRGRRRTVLLHLNRGVQRCGVTVVGADADNHHDHGGSGPPDRLVSEGLFSIRRFVPHPPAPLARCGRGYCTPVCRR